MSDSGRSRDSKPRSFLSGSRVSAMIQAVRSAPESASVSAKNSDAPRPLMLGRFPLRLALAAPL